MYLSLSLKIISLKDKYGVGKHPIYRNVSTNDDNI